MLHVRVLITKLLCYIPYLTTAPYLIAIGLTGERFFCILNVINEPLPKDLIPIVLDSGLVGIFQQEK